MSWADAQSAAQLWIDRKQLKNSDLKGHLIDLNELFAGAPWEGRFRVMVFQAGARILKKRGANTNIADFITGE